MSFRKIISGVIAAVIVFTFGMVSVPTDGWAQLDEMIVSVRKRDELLQDIPISVTVISATQIRQLDINDVRDIARYSSSLIFDPGNGPNDLKYAIRGIRNTRGRPSSAFLVDGIDVTAQSVVQRGNSQLATTRLLDVERVEVVLGPQSALYGRSAFAGAVQYVTKDPAEEFEGSVDFDIGNHGRYDVSGGVSGPVTDSFALRLNANYWNEDGFYKEIVRNSPVGGGDGFGVALTGKWEATDRLSFKGRVEYSEDDFDMQARVMLEGNVVTAPPAAACGPSSTHPLATSGRGITGLGECVPLPYHVGKIPKSSAYIDPRFRANSLTGEAFPGAFLDLFRVSLVTEWELDNATLTSWSGYTDAYTGFLRANPESRPAGPIGNMSETAMFGQYLEASTDITQISQELRAASDWDFPVQLTFGGLYWKEDVKRISRNWSFSGCKPEGELPNDLPGVFCPLDATELIGPILGRPQARPLNRDTTHWSTYGMMEWEITDQWKLSAETRYVREKETVLGQTCDEDAMTILNASDPHNDIFTAGRGTACLGARSGSTVSKQDIGAIFLDPAVFEDGEHEGLTGAEFGGAIPHRSDIRQAPHRRIGDTTKSDYFVQGFKLEWTPDDDTLLFASVSKGIKPGGIVTGASGAWMDTNQDSRDENDDGDFDDLRADGTPELNIDEVRFLSEKLWSYEFGVKRTWLGGNLRTNASAFYQIYTDRQVSTQLTLPDGSSGGRIVNAGEAEVLGFEFDSAWQATDNLSFTAAYTYMPRAKYTDFESLEDSIAAITEAELGAGEGCAEVIIIPDPSPSSDDPHCRTVLTGNDLEKIPHHNFVGTVTYQAPLYNTGFDWFLGGDAFYTGSRFVEEANSNILQDYHLINLRAGITSDRWEILAYVDNVLDNKAIQTAEDYTSQIFKEDWCLVDAAARCSNATVRRLGTSTILAFLPDPITWGVRARASF